MTGAPHQLAGAEPDSARGLGGDGLRRWAGNRLALASAVFVLLVAGAGHGAPLVSRYVTHFSYDEIHSALALRPPGTRDISYDHPTFDGDASGYDLFDADGDGLLAGAPLAATGAYPSCPELDRLEPVARFYDFFMAEYDTVAGDALPTAGTLRPDGFVTWREFPAADAALTAELRGQGLAGPDAFRHLDTSGDDVISQAEVTERSRLFRWSHAKVALLRDFDDDRDHAISRAEFPGAPELHTFLLGTDGRGRDVLTRLAYGARISITIALLATLVSLVIGVTWGAVAGYLGGRTDDVMMRLVDVLYGLPYFFIVVLLMAILERSTINLFIALGAVQWLNMARVVRGQVIGLRRREFVLAARALGASRAAIIWRHIVRNAAGPVIVYATLLVPGVILQEAFLSFLGLGVQPPEPSWGSMITEGAGKLQDHPWLIVWPGLALALTLFAMNFVGDGLRDALDPQADSR